MSELDEAIALLERAVARLEEAPVPPAGEDRAAEVAEALTARVDAALARIDKLLGQGG
jgi:hypothetical protein